MGCGVGPSTAPWIFPSRCFASPYRKAELRSCRTSHPSTLRIPDYGGLTGTAPRIFIRSSCLFDRAQPSRTEKISPLESGSTLTIQTIKPSISISTKSAFPQGWKLGNVRVSASLQGKRLLHQGSFSPRIEFQYHSQLDGNDTR